MSENEKNAKTYEKTKKQLLKYRRMGERSHRTHPKEIQFLQLTNERLVQLADFRRNELERVADVQYGWHSLVIDKLLDAAESEAHYHEVAFRRLSQFVSDWRSKRDAHAQQVQADLTAQRERNAAAPPRPDAPESPREPVGLPRDTRAAIETLEKEMKHAYTSHPETRSTRVLVASRSSSNLICHDVPDSHPHSSSSESVRLTETRSSATQETTSDITIRSNSSGFHPMKVRALAPFEGRSNTQLTVRTGDLIVAVCAPTDSGWQYGQNLQTGKVGWYPFAFVESVAPLDSISDAAVPAASVRNEGAQHSHMARSSGDLRINVRLLKLSIVCPTCHLLF